MKRSKLLRQPGEMDTAVLAGELKEKSIAESAKVQEQKRISSKRWQNPQQEGGEFREKLLEKSGCSLWRLPKERGTWEAL